MSADIMPFCGFVGAAFLLLCVVVGAYVVLRGAWVAVVITWGRQEEMDQSVRGEMGGIAGRL